MTRRYWKAQKTVTKKKKWYRLTDSHNIMIWVTSLGCGGVLKHYCENPGRRAASFFLELLVVTQLVGILARLSISLLNISCIYVESYVS